MTIMDWWKMLFGISIFAMLFMRVIINLQDRIRGRKLPLHFFGPFSKGQLIVYVVQCFAMPTIFTFPALVKPTDDTSFMVGIMTIMVFVLLLGGEVAAYFLDRHFGGK